jgi:hypothetical protein
MDVDFRDPNAEYTLRDEFNGKVTKMSTKEPFYLAALEDIQQVKKVSEYLDIITNAQREIKKYGSYENYMKNSPTAKAVRKEENILNRASRTLALQYNKQLIKSGKLTVGVKPAFGITYAGVPELETVLTPKSKLYPVSTPRTRYYEQKGMIKGSAFTLTPKGKVVEIHDIATKRGVVVGSGQAYSPSLLERVLIRDRPITLGEYGSHKSTRRPIKTKQTSARQKIEYGSGFMGAYDQLKKSPAKKNKQKEQEQVRFGSAYTLITGYTQTPIKSPRKKQKHKQHTVRERTWGDLLFVK